MIAVPGMLQGLGVLEWTLLAVAVLVVCYSVYLAVDERSSLRFAVPAAPASRVLGAALVVAGAAYFAARGMRASDLAASCVLAAIGVSMLLVRSGVGPHGIYSGGMRIGWDKVDAARAVPSERGTVVRYAVRGAERELELPGADAAVVEAFLADMRKIH